MDPSLRQAWTEIITVEDYERHMASIGQAQAAAGLTAAAVAWARPVAGARVVVVGAGTGQMLDFLDVELLRPFQLTFTDLNPAFLARLRERLSAHGLAGDVLIDDVERSSLGCGADLLLATLVLEHIDWRRGVAAFARLSSRAIAVVTQENPAGMASAITPGRALPPSLERAAAVAHATLIPRDQLVEEFARHDFTLRMSDFREVADRKRLHALYFSR